MPKFDFRNPKNASLRAAVGLRQEDVLESLLGAPKLQAAADTIGQEGWRSLLNQLIQILGPVFAALLLQKFTPKPPAEVPLPAPSPAPAPVIPVVPLPPAARIPHIVGGQGKITGLTENGPTGPRVAGDRLAQILAGLANAPHDSRFEIDITPMLEDGSLMGPDDDRWSGQPGAPKRPGDSDGPLQPVRLEFDWDGDGSADLAHEYANFGCNPRIRVRTPLDGGGILSNIRFRLPDYGGGKLNTVLITPGPIHVGRGA